MIFSIYQLVREYLSYEVNVKVRTQPRVQNLRRGGGGKRLCPKTQQKYFSLPNFPKVNFGFQGFWAVKIPLPLLRKFPIDLHWLVGGLHLDPLQGLPHISTPRCGRAASRFSSTSRWRHLCRSPPSPCVTRTCCGTRAPRTSSRRSATTCRVRGAHTHTHTHTATTCRVRGHAHTHTATTCWVRGAHTRIHTHTHMLQRVG